MTDDAAKIMFTVKGQIKGQRAKREWQWDDIGGLEYVGKDKKRDVAAVQKVSVCVCVCVCMGVSMLLFDSVCVCLFVMCVWYMKNVFCVVREVYSQESSSRRGER